MKWCKILSIWLLIAAWPSGLGAQSPSQAETTVNALGLSGVPGFVLLDNAPQVVERPGSASELSISILSQTSGGLNFPDRYGLEIAPFWMGNAFQDLSFSEYSRNASWREAFKRTFSLSLATDLIDESELAGPSAIVGIGTRFSLFTGAVDTTETAYVQTLSEIRTLLGERSSTLAKDIAERHATLLSNDREYQMLDSLRKAAADNDNEDQERRFNTLLAERDRQMLQDLEQERDARLRQNEERLREHSESLSERRVGPTLELAGAAALHFPERDFDSGRVARWGAWATGGYTGRKVSLLAVARFLYDDLVIGTDARSLDFGGRLIYDESSGRFSISGEAVYRAGISEGTDNRYRLDVSIAYALDASKTINFTFGRDFKGTTASDGNLLALLNLVLGFGSDRPGFPLH